MRFVTPALGLYAAVAVTAAVPAADVPKKPTPDEVRKRFYRCWLEVERVEAGVKTTDPGRLGGECFTPRSWIGWDRRGELSSGPGGPGPRVASAADPIRVDFRDNLEQAVGKPPRIRVRPAIARFDGDKLVIARSAEQSLERELKPGEDYPGRPTDFTSTKENGVTVSTYKPCGPYDQD